MIFDVVKIRTYNSLPKKKFPEFQDADLAFGADAKCYFNRYKRPDVPHKFSDMAGRLFFEGGALPAFADDIDPVKARRAIRALLCSFAPAHEAKESTVAYALWVWTTPASERAKKEAKS